MNSESRSKQPSSNRHSKSHKHKSHRSRSPVHHRRENDKKFTTADNAPISSSILSSTKEVKVKDVATDISASKKSKSDRKSDRKKEKKSKKSKEHRSSRSKHHSSKHHESSKLVSDSAPLNEEVEAISESNNNGNRWIDDVDMEVLLGIEQPAHRTEVNDHSDISDNDNISKPEAYENEADETSMKHISSFTNNNSQPRAYALSEDEDVNDMIEQLEKKKSEDEVESEEDMAPPKTFYYPAIQGCRSVEEFQCLNRIEEGTYGVVYRAKDKRTNEIVALKRLKMERERYGFPITSLREINTLMKSQHENVVRVREVVVGSNMDKIFLVMDYVEHDLKSLMEVMKQPFTIGEVKCLLIQLLKAVAHLHSNWILHRDLKTSNLLLSHKGVLRVGDFGLAREYGSPLKDYTSVVVTLWYRAPELLLGMKKYTTPIDLWSVGCIFGELLLMKPMFQGKGEADQINCIFRELGTPTEKIWPGVSELPTMKRFTFVDNPYNHLRNRLPKLSSKGLNLLNSLLTYDPRKRITADDALNMKDSYFDETPLPIDTSMFPTWPAKSEGGHRVTKLASPKPPEGGDQANQLELGDSDMVNRLNVLINKSSSSARTSFLLKC